MLVDDDPDYLYIMRKKLEKFGFQVVTAAGQPDAEKTILTFKPDLAILDLMMESEDSGFILSYKIRKKYPDVPIIIATAVTAETGIVFDLKTNEDRNWIKADMYMDKGIRDEQLLGEINKLLRI